MNAVILLPDSGSRYLSKVYNDNWMRENGFLESESSMGTVDTLLSTRESRELISVSAESKVTEVIGVLKLHGVSQLPVVDNNKLIGIISERQLLERALKGNRSNVAVGDFVEANYCTISHETDISVLTDLFRRSKVAIVLKDGTPTDIITRIDLIDFISRTTGKREVS